MTFSQYDNANLALSLGAVGSDQEPSKVNSFVTLSAKR